MPSTRSARSLLSHFLQFTPQPRFRERMDNCLGRLRMERTITESNVSESQRLCFRAHIQMIGTLPVPMGLVPSLASDFGVRRLAAAFLRLDMNG
jgi:hypothetical protein